MAGGIFISYRREDSQHASGRLVDRLRQTFSHDDLYLDVDSTGAGLDFRKVLSQRLQACKVLLAVIGPGWLTSRDRKGDRRLDSPEDLVRVEIAEALARDIRVIPVLVDGARMPAKEDLPANLQPLADRQAVRLSHEQFKSDVDDLTRNLAKVVGPSRSNVVRLATVILALAVAALAGYLAIAGFFGGWGLDTMTSTKQDPLGRGDPGTAGVRVGSTVVGKVVKVLVAVNDKVEKEQVLIRLDDAEAGANLAAAEADEKLARRERDNNPRASDRHGVADAEDAVYAAERQVMAARFELDAALASSEEFTDQQRAGARSRLEKAQGNLAFAYLKLGQALANPNLPDPNRFEVALTKARNKVASAAAQLEKTRIRAPSAGTVLRLNVKEGETVQPASATPLAVIGEQDRES